MIVEPLLPEGTCPAHAGEASSATANAAARIAASFLRTYPIL